MLVLLGHRLWAAAWPLAPWRFPGEQRDPFSPTVGQLLPLCSKQKVSNATHDAQWCWLLFDRSVEEK